MHIRPATPQDAPAILAIIAPTIRAGQAYPLDRAMGEEAMLATWFAADKQCFVAETDGMILGTYYLRANQGGGGAHVANCGYMVGEAARGRGVARAMCTHSLDAARGAGFSAMQFNLVVSANVVAVHLWQAMGFEIVGRLPRAFAHPQQGLVDALVMFRDL
jgi:L-amino acid N-acyltransferase YncA